MLGGQLGDLPLPWATNRADLFQVPCTSHRAAGLCKRFQELTVASEGRISEPAVLTRQRISDQCRRGFNPKFRS